MAEARRDRFPLADVKVLDLTQYVAGPYCTQVLADLGATVLKVERPPGGDVYRGQGPVFRAGESASFLALNRGKRSVALDFRDPADRERLLGLADEADVLVENMRPGTLSRHGLGPEALAARNPRLIYCSISGFGQSGPEAERGAYDITIQALSGLMSLTGHPGQPPAKIPVAALDFGAALYGVIGVLAAIHQRAQTGRGQHVTTSLLETSLAWLSMHATTYLLGSDEPGPMGSRSPFFAPYEAYATADGYLAIVGTGGNRGWESFCAALGLEALVNDPRFADNSRRVANADELHDIVEAVLREHETAYWESRLTGASVPYAPVRRLAEVLDSPQVSHLGAIRDIDHPVAGKVPIVRLPLALSAAASTASSPPPMLDADRGRGFDPSPDGAEGTQANDHAARPRSAPYR